MSNLSYSYHVLSIVTRLDSGQNDKIVVDCLRKFPICCFGVLFSYNVNIDNHFKIHVICFLRQQCLFVI